MKKITLVLLMSFLSLIGYSQVPQGFESGIPGTWAVIHNGLGANQWTTSTATPVCEGATSAFMNARQNLGAAGLISEDWLVSSQVLVPTNGQLRFCTRMSIAGNNATEIFVRISTSSQTNLGSFVNLASYTDETINTVFNENEVKTVSLNGFAGQNVYIAFIVKYTQPAAGINGDRLFLDDVKVVEQCIDPSDLIINAADITQTSAILGWTDNVGATTFQVEIFGPGPTSVGIGTATFAAGAPPRLLTVNTANLVPPITLMPTTAYQFYVRAQCTQSVSQWIGPFNFTTRSPGETCSSAAPIPSPLPYSTSNNTSNFTDDLDGSPGATGCGTTGNFMNGNNVYYQYTATFTGVVNITMTPNPAVNNTGLFVYNSCANVGVSCIAGVANTNGTPRVINLPVTSGQTYYILISTSGTPNTFAYDLVLQQVNCPPPTNLAASGGLNTADLSWNGVGAASFEYVVQTAGSPIPTAPGVATTTPSANGVTQLFNGTPLMASTAYQYWVRASCGDGTFSAWAGPFLFNTTICNVADQCNYTFRMTDSFGDGWNGATMQVRQNGIVVATIGTTFTAGAGPIDVTVPLCHGVPFDLFWNAGGTFAGEVRVAIINSFSQQIYALTTSSAALVGTALYSGTVDCLNPLCLQPTGIVVGPTGDTTAQVNWTAVTGITNYQVIWSTSPTVPTAGTAGTPVTGNTYTITGLTSATIYYVFVRAICPGNPTPGQWSSGTQFNTTICPVSAQCNYTFRMRDSFGDGWNGAQMQVRQNGIVVATIGTTFTAGAGPIDVIVPLCDGLPFDLFWSVGGTFAGEVRVEIINNFTQSVFNMNVASAPLVGTVLYTDNLVECNVPECLPPSGVTVTNIGNTSAQVNWTPITGITNYQVYWSTTPGIPGTGVSGTPATGGSYTITGLTGATIYYVFVRTICPTGSSNWSAVTQFNTTVCAVADQCNYTFVLRDSFGDGWNGAQMQVRQNGIVVATIGTTFTAGAGPINITVPLCNGLPFDLFWSVGGTFAGEVRVQIINDSAQTVYNMTVASAPLVGTVLYTDNLVECGIPECLAPTNVVVSNPGTFSLQVAWTPAVGNPPGSTFEVIVVNVGTGTQASFSPVTSPYTIMGLNPSTLYNVFVRTLCTGANPLSNQAGPGTGTTLPTCPQPTNLQTVGTTSNSQALLTWVNNSTATLFEVWILPSGSPAPTGANPGIITSLGSAANPFITPSLPVGFYDFYVRAICSTSDKSIISGPGGFYIPGQLEACAGVDVQLDTPTPGVLNLCPGENCVDLSATYLNTGQTTTYNVGTIPFEPPFPFTGGTQTSVNTDDVWSPTITLPFNFCFFGQNYTKALVGSNGVITFGITGEVPGGTQNPGGNCAWAYNVPIPNATFPIRNAIYGPYQDIDPGINNAFAIPNINYQILGEAPCRVFVVNFSQVAQFSGTCNNNPTVGAQTSQIVMYETSNIIEVYVQRRVPCTSWNNGNAVIGIQNQAGTQAHVPPGRNTGTWTANNEAWRFTPAGPSNVTFQWLKDDVFYSSDLNINVCVSETTNMQAQAIYTACGGAETVTTSNVLLQVLDELPVQDDVATCGFYTLPVLSVGNYFSEPGGTGTAYTSGDQISQTQTVYVYAVVTSSSGTCNFENSFEVTILPDIVPQFNPVADICLNGTAPGLSATSTDGYNGLWTPSAIDTSVAGTFTYVFTPFGEPDCILESSIDVTILDVPVDTLENQNVCVSFTLPVLENGNYFTATNGGGTALMAGDVITTDSTIYIYNQVGTCTNESSFTVTIGPLDVGTFTDVTACDMYVLPALTLGNYYTETMGGGEMLEAGAEITSTQVIYVYASSDEEGCNDEATFTVTINTIQVDEPDDVFVCDSYTLPELMVGIYYDAPGGTGTVIAAGTEFTTDTTIYIYGETGSTPNCTSESSFTITVGPLDVGTFTDVTACNTYILPVLTLGEYYTETGGQGTMLAQGSEVTTSQLIYVYAESGVGCNDEASFDVTIITIVADIFEDASACDSYTLPTLSTNNAFYDAAGGTGNVLDPLVPLTTTQMVYVYAQSGKTPNCTDESSFTVTINATPLVDTLTDVSVCDTYTLPVLTNGMYYATSGGLDPMDANVAITSTQMIYIYAQTGTEPNCFAESSFTVTVNTIVADVIPSVIVCDSYTLPALSANNAYYSTTGGIDPINASTPITSTQTIFVFAQSGTTPNCTQETSFTVTVNVTPQATTIQNVTSCVGDSFTLPTGIVGNYFTQTGGVGPITATTVSTTQTIYVYASSGTAPNVCSTETSFTVTFNSATADQLSDVEECGSYVLPELSAGNSYHTAPNGGGTMLLAGTEVTTSQTVYIFAQNGTCNDNSDFDVTINGCVIQKGISPNGDGSNDYFDLTNFDVRNLDIFNRYGRKVYNKPNYSNEWYGQSNKGEELPDGTYYFVIEFNNEPTKTGWIYIIRENK